MTDWNAELHPKEVHDLDDGVEQQQREQELLERERLLGLLEVLVRHGGQIAGHVVAQPLWRLVRHLHPDLQNTAPRVPSAWPNGHA